MRLTELDPVCQVNSLANILAINEAAFQLLAQGVDDLVGQVLLAHNRVQRKVLLIRLHVTAMKVVAASAKDIFQSHTLRTSVRNLIKAALRRC